MNETQRYDLELMGEQIILYLNQSGHSLGEHDYAEALEIILTRLETAEQYAAKYILQVIQNASFSGDQS